MGVVFQLWGWGVLSSASFAGEYDSRRVLFGRRAMWGHPVNHPVPSARVPPYPLLSEASRCSAQAPVHASRCQDMGESWGGAARVAVASCRWAVAREYRAWHHHSGSVFVWVYGGVGDVESAELPGLVR